MDQNLVNLSTRHGRLPELDLLRFTAAVSVAIYHWTYRPVVMGVPSNTAFGPLQEFSRFGYLGVNLFFLVSGFVILWSSSNRRAMSFLASRVSRLYPSFWVCVILTALVLWASGQAQSGMTGATVALNLTMVPGQLGVPLVDVVYWTLFVELKFYLMVFFALVVIQKARIEAALFIWLATVVLAFGAVQIGLNSLPVHLLKSFSLYPYAQLFIAGAFFFLIWRNGRTHARIAAVAVCLGLAMIQVSEQAPAFVRDVTPMDKVGAVGIIITLFAVFVCLALKVWKVPTTPILVQLGALTYPLYLLHNGIGKTIWAMLPVTLDNGRRLFVVAVGVGALTWSVTKLVEQRACPRLNAMLQYLVNFRANPVVLSVSAERSVREDAPNSRPPYVVVKH
jgi:peptidoglycan/LPS O-acetylase OafA/YrhL